MASSAVVLLIGDVGGFIDGWAGKTSCSDYQRAELQQIEGRPGGGNLTEIGKAAETLRPVVMSIAINVGEVSGMGSGFVIGGDDHILTNNHVASTVVDRQDMQVSVTFWNGGKLKEAPTKTIGRDLGTDLVVIKVEGVTGLTVAQLGDFNAVVVSDTVIVMGSSQGLGGAVTSDIISALNRPVRLVAERTDTDNYTGTTQTDTSIDPNNSGDPLVNIHDATVDISTVILSSSGGSQSLGFTILVNSAVAIVEQLIAGEQPVHLGAGVATCMVSSGALAGVEVTDILPGGIADREDLQEDDVITVVEDHTMSSVDELMVTLWTVGVGNKAVLEIIRHGAELEAKIIPGQGDVGFPVPADLVDLADLAAQYCMRGVW